MMYPYMVFADGTEVNHSQLIDKDGKQTVIVHFERPTEKGFDTARCELPEYRWIKKEGYTAEEIANFETFLQHNAHLLFKYAASGGIHFA